MCWVPVGNNITMKILHKVFIVITLFFMGCSKPEKDMIKKDFMKIYPTAVMLSYVATEGDSDNVYYEIKYKSGNKILKEIFLYQNISDVWKMSSHFTPKVGQTNF